MNIHDLESQLTDAQRAARDAERRQLEALVERRRLQLEQGGHATALERLEAPHLLAHCGDVPQVGGLFAEMAAGFQRLAEKEAAFRASLRPEIERVPQVIACAQHGPGARVIDLDATCNATRPTGRLKIVYAACPQCAEAEEAAHRRKYWLRHGVEERNVQATFAGWTVAGAGADAEAKRKAADDVRRWCETRGNFLLLTGRSGTGKGFLATAALKWNGAGIFIKHPDMLADLRASYETGRTQALVERWQDCEMLVLDEFGLSPGGRDEEPMLYQVLADRYDRRRPTIITSNLELGPLREAIGFRLLNRLQEDCVTVVCRWGSWRTGRGAGNEE